MKCLFLAEGFSNLSTVLQNWSFRSSRSVSATSYAIVPTSSPLPSACHGMVDLSRFAELSLSTSSNLVPRGRGPFGYRQGSRPLAKSNSRSPQFTDFPSLCACSESSLTNLIGSGLNLLCSQSHSKPECRSTWPGVPIFPAHDKRDPWGRGCISSNAKL